MWDPATVSMTTVIRLTSDSYLYGSLFSSVCFSFSPLLVLPWLCYDDLTSLIHKTVLFDIIYSSDVHIQPGNGKDM